MNGIRSLNAGAYANLPQQDIRLSGDHRSTYTQRRRAQMAGGGIMGSNAGSMLVAPTADGSRPGYGKLSDLKNKNVDDLIPNEIKENPMLTAAIVGGGINQFGLPDWLVPDAIASGSNVGQNWIGDLLGKGLPGGTVDMVLGKGGTGQTLGTGIKNLIYGMPQGRNMLGDLDPNNVTGWMEKGLTMSPTEFFTDYVSSKLPGSNQQQQQTTQTGKYPINWKGPLMIGTAVGAADY